MALLGGSVGLGKQIAGMAALAAPRKITQTAGLSPLDFGVPSTLDPAQGTSTPGKVTSFGPMSGGATAFDPLSGGITKFNPADLFAPPSAAGPSQGLTPRPQPNRPVVGGMASLGGDWAGVDQWNAAVAQAAAATGVPANLIKAVMKLESNGQNLGPNPAGAQGPMQVVGRFWNSLGYDLSDPRQNIMAGATILKQMYDTMGDWEGAVRAYFAGPGGAYTGNQDMYGTNPATYWGVVNRNWQQLNAAGGAPAAGPNPGGAGASFQAMFGTSAVPSWGEFNAESSLPYYGYGRDYGLSGTVHTGLDIPMAFGAPMRAAFSGTVRCAGTGPGCDAFGYVPNFGGAGAAMPGAGRIEIVSDDGNTVLIYGHSAGSAVRPGQRVNAGDLVGYNGGMNSAHVHLEARVRDPSTASGWRIVDPRQVLGGGQIVQQTGGNPYQQQGYGQPLSFAQGIRAFRQGWS